MCFTTRSHGRPINVCLLISGAESPLKCLGDRRQKIQLEMMLLMFIQLRRTKLRTLKVEDKPKSSDMDEETPDNSDLIQSELSLRDNWATTDTFLFDGCKWRSYLWGVISEELSLRSYLWGTVWVKDRRCWGEGWMHGFMCSCWRSRSDSRSRNIALKRLWNGLEMV